MGIRSKEDLIDKIDRDHVWRIREIVDFEFLITSPEISDIRKRALCRSGIALLYAHWEGFIKKSAAYFLEYLANQRLPLSELKSNFITLVVKDKIDVANLSNKISAFDEVTQYIIKNQNVKAKIPYKKGVDTKSNLSTTVLKEIIWCLGLDYSKFETKEKLIDSNLVSKRNHIAHGGALDIDVRDFTEMAYEVKGLLSIFKNLIENSAILEQYRNR